MAIVDLFHLVTLLSRRPVFVQHLACSMKSRNTKNLILNSVRLVLLEQGGRRIHIRDEYYDYLQRGCVQRTAW